jgi:hypothetical protein
MISIGWSVAYSSWAIGTTPGARDLAIGELEHRHNRVEEER